MNILVTGANGFLGSWLVRALLARGYGVACLVRPGSDVSGLVGLEYERVFMRVNAEGTRLVCEALVATGARPRLVLAGSLGASGPSTPGRPKVEEDPLQPRRWEFSREQCTCPRPC